MYFISNYRYVKELKEEASSLQHPLIKKETTLRLLRELCKKGGGDDRSRTCDPLRARQMLSQLSYTPSIYSK